MNDLAKSLSNVADSLQGMNASLRQIAASLETINRRLDHLERRERVSGGAAGLVTSAFVIIVSATIGGGI